MAYAMVIYNTLQMLLSHYKTDIIFSDIFHLLKVVCNQLHRALGATLLIWLRYICFNQWIASLEWDISPDGGADNLCSKNGNH